MLARALFEKGYVNQEFIHSVVNRERKSATAILKERIEWGNERVALVFMLAISKENHSDIRGIIGKIASLTESPLIVHGLTGAKDYREFVRILEENY